MGKTSAAIQIAEHFHTSIISADSRQCFKELNIGVSKPSAEELQAIHHYFINSNSVRDTVNAALFEQWALGWAEEIFMDAEVAVIAGGTGLYVKAFCEGLDEMPIVAESVRKQVQQNYKEFGLVWLQQQIEEKDPSFYREGEILNPQRMMRALEVVTLNESIDLLFSKQHPKAALLCHQEIWIGASQRIIAPAISTQGWI